MGRPCSICTHDDREDIDGGLVSGTSLRDLAARFSVSVSALSRHSQDHVSAALRAVVVSREREQAETLMDRVESLIERTERLLSSAETSGKVAQALAAVREMRALLELLGKASGELKPDGLVQVLNVQTSPEWLAIRSALLGALGPHPDARVAVAGALAALEAGA